MVKMARIAALLLAALALVVAGCGGSDGGGTTTGGDAPSTTADAGALRSGGEATIASAQGVGQLDPYKILFAFEGVVHPLMWSALTRYTPDGGTEVQPDLAESWEASDDFRAWTFRLRPDLRLSNGEPLTAEKVAASLRRAFDPDTAFLWAIFMPRAQRIDAPDATTVRIRLASSGRDLPAALTKIAVQDVATLRQIDRDPVVTGPYRVAAFTPDQDLELVPNEHYWGEAPKLDKLTFTKAQDNTAAVTSLRAGEIQALWSIPWTDVRELDGSTDVAVVSDDEPLQNVIVLTDNTSGVFRDVKARQALAHSLNRKAILQAIYADRGIEPGTNNPIPAWSDLVADGLTEYAFDLDKARALFAEAGVGPDTPLTFWAPAGQYSEWTSVGEVLQKDLESIGITMRIETKEISQWAGRFAPAGQTFPDLIVPNVYGGMPVPLNLGSWVPGICECNFDDAEFNDALAAAQAAPDDAAYAEALARAQRVFNEQVPVTLVVQTSIPVGHVSALQGIWIDPTGLARFGDAGFAG